MIGQTLGRYQLLKELGRGGFATVYQGYDAGLERYVVSASDCEVSGRWLRQRIESHFDWQRVADEFEHLYDRVLGDARG